MKSDKLFSAIAAFILLLSLGLGVSQAQGPQPQGNVPSVNVGSTFTYQGQLNKDGAPVDGACDMHFGLWDDPTAGTQIGATLERPAVGVSGGLFTIPDLDFGPTAFTGDARWIEVAVKCAGDPDYVTLSPRQALTAAPYALSLMPGATVAGSAAHGLTVQTDAGGGIGLAASATGTGATYGVAGVATSSQGAGVWGGATATTGSTYGVWGGADSPAGVGVYGYNSATGGSAYGLNGVTDSTAGSGVYGWATATSGVTRGVMGRSDSPAGIGVDGINSATTGVGYGVYGSSDSTAGTAVYGHANASSGATYAVQGINDSTSGRGVRGYATATAGTTYGVVGRASSTDGYGVYGVNDATAAQNGAGVYGESSSAGYGVHGHSPLVGVYGDSGDSTGVGVLGQSTATYQGLGVLGIADSPTGIAIEGNASSTTGDTIGVYAIVQSPLGYGVSAHAQSTTGATIGVFGIVRSPNGTGVEGDATGPTAPWGVYSYGMLGSTGLQANIVRTAAYGWRQLYAVAAPDALFEDVGTAQLTGGRAVVVVDPIFAQAVDLSIDYQVFLTVRGTAPALLFVSARDSAGFTVQGVTLDGQPASCAFDYRIVAKRLGATDVRLAPAQDPAERHEVGR